MRGKVDIVAKSHNDVILAIELDNCTPRKKSIFKLNQIPGAIRVILLRKAGWKGHVYAKDEEIQLVVDSILKEINSYHNFALMPGNQLAKFREMNEFSRVNLTAILQALLRKHGIKIYE